LAAESPVCVPVNTSTCNETPAEGPEDVVEAAAEVSQRQETGFARRKMVVEVDQHRRVTAKSPLVAALTAEIKSKLGTPLKNGANDLTIRYLAASRCKELGVRPLHTRSVVEWVIVMVYTPDHADVSAAVLSRSHANEQAHATLAYAKKSSFFKAFVPRCVYSLCAHGPVMGSSSP